MFNHTSTLEALDGSGDPGLLTYELNIINFQFLGN